MLATRFTVPVAVEAWDQWFRLRTPDGLCDLTVARTWWRVANAVCANDGACALWARHYVHALSQWQLLPDERLLRAAGTGVVLDASTPLTATLNVAAFVAAPDTPQARFDAAGFFDVAALAVRFLDDALLGAHDAAGPRIGLIGFGDALGMMGIAYTDPRALEQARVVGQALAGGALRGSVDMAVERGAVASTAVDVAERSRQRQVPAWLTDAVERHGVRHAELTAIQRQPRLALLANDVSDALDPPRSEENGAAGSLHDARRAIRDAIQPWIDAPIDPWSDGPGCSRQDARDC